MNAKQINIWGGEDEIKEQLPRPSNRKYKTMQQMYGVTEGKQCKTCKRLKKYDYHNKIYYKCELWHISHSSATDIRLKNQACGCYEESEGER